MTHQITLLVATISIFLLCLVQSISSKSTAEWKQMSIYQLLTDRYATTNDTTADCVGYQQQMMYCGGTWVGITNHLDYIKNMGFDAIWISPVWKNLPNAFHGYSIVDIYALNDHFGTDADFKAMIAAAHSMNISVMVDVVPNHMAAVMFDYQQLNPFNSSEHFHDYCYIQNMDYQHNQWRIVNCRLLDLPDLKQENPYVNQTLLNHITNFLQSYEIDGLRMDAVPHMPHWFISEYYKAAQVGAGNKDIFIIGEAFDPRFDFVRSFQQNIPGLFNFPMFFNLVNVYKSGQDPQQISDLWNSLDSSLGNGVDALGLFIDNHDNTRFLYQIEDQVWRLNNALVFIFTVRGIPCLYYGTEQGFATPGDPYNRQPLWPTAFNQSVPIYQYVASLNNLRKTELINGQPFVEVLVNSTIYAYNRGNVFVVTRNSNETIATQDFSLLNAQGTPIYAEGVKLTNWEDSNDFLTVGANGVVTITNLGEMPKVYIDKS
jgi:alpha-amylase